MVKKLSLWFTASDYPFGIFKLLTIILSVLWFTASGYPFGIFKLLTIILSVLVIRSCKSKDRQYNGQKFEDTKGVIRSCKSKDRQYNGQKFEDTKGVIRTCDLQLLVTPLVSSNFWPSYCLSFFDLHFWLPLWYLQTFDHYIVCPSLIYSFWLPLWYL
jgi:competence transcription factor ComK